MIFTIHCFILFKGSKKRVFDSPMCHLTNPQSPDGSFNDIGPLSPRRPLPNSTYSSQALFRVISRLLSTIGSKMEASICQSSTLNGTARFG